MNENKKIGIFEIKDLPENYRNDTIFFEGYYNSNGSWINEGDKICRLRIGLYDNNSKKYTGADIVAQNNGYLSWTENKGNILKNGQEIYRLDINKTSDYLYSNPNNLLNPSIVDVVTNIAKRQNALPKFDEVKDLLNNKNNRYGIEYKNISKIEIDEFSNTKNISWKQVSTFRRESSGIWSKSDDNSINMMFSFNYLMNKDFIIFQFNSKQVNIKKGDRISFLFDNNNYINYDLTSEPFYFKNENDKFAEFKLPLFKNDLELFKNSNIKKWKILLKNQNKEILGGNKGGKVEYENYDLFTKVTRKFAYDYEETVLNEIENYEPLILNTDDDLNKANNESCSVYLMKDISNGFYKIGISNLPEYREKTLQSEKPTIELIISKSYPSRKIANTIEKSLHELFSEKRLRGEWFELNPTEVDEIIQTLS